MIRCMQCPLAVVALAVSIAAGSSPSSFARSTYPNKPIHFIVPFAAGGAADLVI